MKIKSQSRIRRIPLLALAAMVAATAFPASAAAADKGKVTVVHAVPDLTVDVYANDGLFLEDFEPGTITPPARLDPGHYDIEVTPANSASVALSATASVDSGTDAAAVAYLEKNGDPTLGLFKNNQRPIRERRARVTVRHTAAAPEVDVRYKRPGGKWKLVTTDLMNGEQAKRGFRARRYRFDVVLSGKDTRVLGPVTLKLERRTHYFVYAWGSAADDSLALNLSTRRLQVAE
jgi:Domain of unknown function (DUF4397)